MFDRILVPLDGSKAGETALPSVKGLVSKLAPQKVEVILIQVLSSLVHYVIAGEVSAQIPYTEQEIDAIKNSAQTYLDKIADELKKTGADVRTMVVTGNPAEGILKASEDTGSDLIAMSTHGRSGLRRWAFGSVAEKVLHGSVIPVLMVMAPKGNPPG